jgi:hypothetical protein
MTRDEAARIADKGMREFIGSMADASNPGSGRHEIGLHHVHGWILEYDPTVGGSEIQAIIDLDGVIHARHSPRSLHTHKWSASEWVLRDANELDWVAKASAFAEHLSRLLAFDHAVGGASDEQRSPWGPPLGHDTDRSSSGKDAGP